jgi:hypothetical protein
LKKNILASNVVSEFSWQLKTTFPIFYLSGLSSVLSGSKHHQGARWWDYFSAQYLSEHPPVGFGINHKKELSKIPTALKLRPTREIWSLQELQKPNRKASTTSTITFIRILTVAWYAHSAIASCTNPSGIGAFNIKLPLV